MFVLMKFEEFKEKVFAEIKNYMPKEYSNCILKEEEIYHVNEKITAITISITEKLAASISLNAAYDTYIMAQSFDEAVRNIVKKYVEACIYQTQVDARILSAENLKWENIKEKLVIQVINTLNNQDMLKNVPHREFLDLSIVYRYLITGEKHQVQSILLSNKMAEYLNVSEEELYESAKEQTKKLMPVTIETAEDIVTQLLQLEDEEEELFFKSCSGELKPMYIISNEFKKWGSNSIINEELLETTANAFNDNFYIIPSSIHEIMVLPKSSSDVDTISQTIRETNDTFLSKDLLLSYSLYYYDRHTKRVSIVK